MSAKPKRLSQDRATPDGERLLRWLRADEPFDMYDITDHRTGETFAVAVTADRSWLGCNCLQSQMGECCVHVDEVARYLVKTHDGPVVRLN